MQRVFLIIVSCSLVCIGAYRWGDTKWTNGKVIAMEYFYTEVSQFMVPYIHMYNQKGNDLIYEDIEGFFLPLIADFRATKYEAVVKEDESIGQDETDSSSSSQVIDKKEEKHEGSVDKTEDQQVVAGTLQNPDISVTEKKVVINRTKLQEFDYLRQNFYQVDNTTTIDGKQLDVNKLLGKDMKLASNVKGPQILIYHTHSREAYKDSKSEDESGTVVALGDYLEILLEQKYGIEVLHHKGKYDVPSRDNAYSNALPALKKLLEENPTIEVVIDLHRDGVPESRHFVTDLNGKPTAQIMFFNGLSRTTAQGDLAYLANPYVDDNLAFSFQMQLAAMEYYPGFTRKIYLKGYRYNMHLCPKSLLVEVGAQTNTFSEAKNAMEPLADILAKVLYNDVNE